MLSPLENYVNKMMLNEVERFPEKTYIHTDKPFYTTNDTIWFKNYLVNGITHKQTNKSNVVYVELISPKDSILYKEKFYVQENTFGTPGDITINPKWESGIYQLRSYTNYMRNQNEEYFFKKSIHIEREKEPKETLNFIDDTKLNIAVESLDSIQENSKKIEKINLIFYPEGGNAIADVINKFGVKATDELGNGVKVLGAIKEKGKKEVVAMFRTFDFGLGNTSFIPKKNVQYVAEIQLNGRVQRYTLDKASKDGVQLSIINNQESLALNVTSTKEKLEGYFLIGHMRGKILFNKTINSNKLALNYKLIMSEVPNGISHFTLFDATGKPKAERLVFINNPKKSSTTKIVVNKKKFSKRDQVSYNIEILDDKNNKENASLSLSVTQKSSVPLLTKESIKSWLLLNSDLRGEVPNAAVFFDLEKTKKERDYLLESLMLTHGWRRFTWEDYLKEEFKGLEYKSEKGLTISGKVLAMDKDIYTKKVETTLLLVGESLWSEKQTVLANGRFNFRNIVVTDSAKAVLQGKAIGVKENKEKKIKFLLDKEEKSPSITSLTKSQSEKENLFFENYKNIKSYINQINFTFDGVNQLNEVVIRGKKKNEIKDLYDEYVSQFPNSYYGRPSNRIITDSLVAAQSLTVFDLLRTVPGVQVKSSGDGFGGGNVIIRGASSLILSSNPLFLLDGIEVSGDQISFLTADEISVIDILKGNDAAIFGSRGAGGVIAIYSKAPGKQKGIFKKPGIINFTINPFYKAKEFYSKDYFRESNKKSIEPDYRTTLHWNPRANAYKNSMVSSIFYTGDQTGIFQFELEGITEDGELIYETTEIEVVD